MTTAEIVTIGTELLLGEIQDTNSRYLARYLRNMGIDLFRATTIGDNVNRISQVLQEAMLRSDIIVTTGGLGPTVDDPTRYAVAKSLSVETEFRPELWEQIQDRFRKYGRIATDNNRQQALIPKGAIPVANPVGTAPAFIVDTGKCVIISVPGVPREMEYLMETDITTFIRQRFQINSVITARVLHTAGVGESQVDEWVGDLETGINPTVGLLAHPGQTDIRVTAKGSSAEETNAMIDKVVAEIQKRMCEHIYGLDEETLEDVVRIQLKKQALKLAILECNLHGSLMESVKNIPLEFIESKKSISTPLEEIDLKRDLQNIVIESGSDIGLGVSVEPFQDSFVMIIAFLRAGSFKTSSRRYAGPPALINIWSTNTALDFLRRNLAN